MDAPFFESVKKNAAEELYRSQRHSVQAWQ